MPSNPCTMTDVAARAGVHPATVSRALRDDPRITPAQRAKIHRAAAQLGYRTNPLVAALMSARRAGRRPVYQATLACITRYPAERAAAFARDFGRLLTGARERAAAQGYRFEEFNLDQPGLTARRATEILLSRGIHGLLVAPLHSTHEPVELDWREFSSVAIGYSLSHVPVSRVSHNQFTALGLASRHCRAAGWKRIGLVVPRRVHEKVEKRWMAACLLDQSEQPAAHRVPPLLLDDESEAEFARWFLRHEPEIVVGIHLPAILGWLKRLGRRVPEEVNVVGLDRRPEDRGIAGIDQDYDSIGATAIDLLVGMTHRNERGLPAKPVTVLIDGTWVNGRTLRAAPEGTKRA